MCFANGEEFLTILTRNQGGGGGANAVGRVARTKAGGARSGRPTTQDAG